MLRFLLGDDVFISYSRRDGAHYAAALASRLGEREFDVSCFLDQWGAAAANELSRPVIGALRRSYVLVLIGTPGAIDSAMVRQEVASFSRTRFWARNRPILPINVAGALDNVSWAELTGLNRTPETHDACSGGLPSDRVVRLVRDSCSFSRRSQRTRLLSMAAVLLLTVSILASLWAYEQTSRATEASLQAEKQTLRANLAGDEAKRRTEEARLAEGRAQESKAQSIAARKETEQQTRIAIARQRAAEAGISVSRGSLLPEGVAMAIEAMRSETAVPLIEGYQVLRQGLGILPHLAAEMRNSRPIQRMSLSADARYVATASDLDGTIRVWDTQSGRVAAQKTYSRRASFVSVAISPRADYLAVGHGGLIEIFDLRAALRGNPGAELASIAFRPVIRTPGATAFSPDGQFFAAVGYQGGMARIWSVDGWKQLREVSGGVSAVGFSPDGKHLFTVSPNGTQVNATAAKASEPQRRSAGPAASVAAFSPDGNHLVTADGDKAVRVWRLARARMEWQEIARFTHQGRATSLAISSTGAHVAVAGEDGTARVWNMAETREVLRLTHGATVTGVAFSRDGTYVATASEDATARLWSTREDSATIALAHRDDVRAVAFSRDGRLVRTVGSDGRVRSWSASSGTEINIANAVAAVMTDGEIPYVFRGAALSADGRHAAIAVSDGTLLTGNTESGETTELSVDDGVLAVSVSPGGKLVAAASPSAIDVWRAAEPRQPVYRFKGSGLRTLAFSNDGRLLAASDSEGVRLWDMSTGRETRRLRTRETINVVCFSTDGRRLAAAGPGRHVYVWEISSTAPPVRLPAGPGKVEAMALSRDGRFFALAGADRTVRVWDAAGSREVARLAHDGAVAALAFSPDGAQLATASRDHTARISLWKPEDLIQEACKRLPQQFKANGACRERRVSRRD